MCCALTVPSSVSNTGTITIATTPLVIGGNLTQTPGAVLQIVLTTETFTEPPLTINGALVNEGATADDVRLYACDTLSQERSRSS